MARADNTDADFDLVPEPGGTNRLPPRLLPTTCAVCGFRMRLTPGSSFECPTCGEMGHVPGRRRPPLHRAAVSTSLFGDDSSNDGDQPPVRLFAGFALILTLVLLFLLLCYVLAVVGQVVKN